jgi:deoxyribonuclease V
MQYRRLHPWTVSIPRARRIQERLRDDLRLAPLPPATHPRHVAGADVSFERGSDVIYGAVVVLSYPHLELVETACSVDRARFPYVPGYLSFREIPVLLKAFRKIRQVPDLILCDGQGIAHPRMFGLASHLGMILETATIGCAKSRLVGEYREPARARGSSSPLTFDGRRVGSVLRTRDGVSPVFVSPGYGIDTRTAVRIVLACSRLRIPEPTRQAHMAVNQLRRQAGGRDGTTKTRRAPGAGTAASRPVARGGPRSTAGKPCPGA